MREREALTKSLFFASDKKTPLFYQMALLVDVIKFFFLDVFFFIVKALNGAIAFNRVVVYSNPNNDKNNYYDVYRLSRRHLRKIGALLDIAL